MLHRVILQGAQVTEALPTPNTLKLALPGVCALVLGEVLALFEALVAVIAFVRFLPRMHTPVSVQIGRVFEPFLTVRALQRLFPRRVAAVLDEFRRGQEAAVTKRAL